LDIHTLIVSKYGVNRKKQISQKKTSINNMPDKNLLEELAETLSDVIQQEYIEAYLGDKEKGLAEKFDKLTEENTHET